MIKFLSMLALTLALTLPSMGASPPGHWSHPYTIQYHLQHDHHVNTNGMSYQQMLYLHDSIHEAERGRYTTRSYTPARRPTFRIFGWRR